MEDLTYLNKPAASSFIPTLSEWKIGFLNVIKHLIMDRFAHLTAKSFITLFFPMFPLEPPKSIRKLKVFWCFHGNQKGTLVKKRKRNKFAKDPNGGFEYKNLCGSKMLIEVKRMECRELLVILSCVCYFHGKIKLLKFWIEGSICRE